jgi:acyl-CoA synthetase (AMP-forming)/AMP-acid ligase II
VSDIQLYNIRTGFKGKYPDVAVMVSHGNLNFTMTQFAALDMAKAQVDTVRFFFSISLDCKYLSPVQPLPSNTPEAIHVVLGFLPLHHSFGLQSFCFQLFFTQTTLVLMPKWNMDVALKLIPKSVSTIQLNILYRRKLTFSLPVLIADIE